jgi:hypothetical protein
MRRVQVLTGGALSVGHEMCACMGGDEGGREGGFFRNLRFVEYGSLEERESGREGEGERERGRGREGWKALGPNPLQRVTHSPPNL